MSFGLQKNSQNKNEIRMKERVDENLKVTINDKIFGIMTKNNAIKEKIEKINLKNYLLREDEESTEKLLNDIKTELEYIKNLIRDFENLIQKKYSQDIDNKDKLILVKNQMFKTIDKEIDNFNKNSQNFQTAKNNLSKKSTNTEEYSEKNGLLSNDDDNDEEMQKYKVNDKQIKYMEDISQYRKDKMQNIYSKVLIVKKMTDDMNAMTHAHDEKLNTIMDNVVPVSTNAKEGFKKLLQASQEDKNFKNNNCCIILVLILAVFFLMLLLINWNRE